MCNLSLSLFLFLSQFAKLVVHLVIACGLRKWAEMPKGTIEAPPTLECMIISSIFDMNLLLQFW